MFNELAGDWEESVDRRDSTGRVVSERMVDGEMSDFLFEEV